MNSPELEMTVPPGREYFNLPADLDLSTHPYRNSAWMSLMLIFHFLIFFDIGLVPFFFTAVKFTRDMSILVLVRDPPMLTAVGRFFGAGIDLNALNAELAQLVNSEKGPVFLGIGGAFGSNRCHDLMTGLYSTIQYEYESI